MTRSSTKTLVTASALSFCAIAVPASAQVAMTPAQCEAMMFAGAQNYSEAQVAGCTPYFQALARNATAPGTFPTRSVTVSVSTSGSSG